MQGSSNNYSNESVNRSSSISNKHSSNSLLTPGGPLDLPPPSSSPPQTPTCAWTFNTATLYDEYETDQPLQLSTTPGTSPKTSNQSPSSSSTFAMIIAVDVTHAAIIVHLRKGTVHSVCIVQRATTSSVCIATVIQC
jgi:hypothetical protein